MKEYKDINIGDLFILPKNTPVWSLSLQNMVMFLDDQYVKITHTVYDKKTIFAMIQLRFENIMLQQYLGKEAINYVDKTNSEIELSFSKLISS